MKSLDNILEIKKLDKANVLGSIEELGLQCKQAYEEVSKIKFPENYKKVNNIVFSAMGGSALGAYVMKSLFFDSLKIPFEIINGYHLPPYVGKDTLVILASYSGTTEETISTAKEALNKQAKIIGITTGGTLSNILKQESIPHYLINPIHNPSNQPRMGTGYSIFGQMAIFNRLGFLNFSQNDVAEVVKTLSERNKEYGLENPEEKNIAKKTAKKILDKITVIVTADFLTNVGRVIRNQIHESAKTFAVFHEIPELNHHLMESLSFPKENRDILKFLFINSDLYPERILKRLKITKEVVIKNGIESVEFKPKSKSKISQTFECIQFGAYINFYMAISNNLDPSKIPWVNYFKERLSNS